MCYECQSDPSCQNEKDCADSCTRSQKTKECVDTSNSNLVCANISFSYNNSGKITYVFQRRCDYQHVIIKHWGCAFHCEVPEGYYNKQYQNSTKCQVCILHFMCSFYFKNFQAENFGERKVWWIWPTLMVLILFINFRGCTEADATNSLLFHEVFRTVLKKLHAKINASKNCTRK